MSEFELMNTDELQSYFSDFHKDFYGFRPRGGTITQWEDSKWLVTQIEGIHNVMDRMMSSPEGREQLRYEGWSVDESKYA